MRRFDVARHQPHPPGYPLFVLAARGARTAAPSAQTALAALSVVSGALGVLAMIALYRRLGGGEPDRTMWPAVAALVAMTTPLYWFDAARPLSDTMGLAAAVGVQALVLGAAGARALAAASFLAGFATGIRTQVLWLTVPLALWKLFAAAPGTPHPAPRTRHQHPAPSTQHPAPITLLSFTAGALLWFVPLVALTGGPAAYWRALSDQGAEDLGGIRMLWTTPTPRALVDALYFAFVAPWAAWPLAAGVLVLAALGAGLLLRRRDGAFVTLAVAFGPYLAFDILFQETFTSRYALPLVVPIAFLATAAIRALPPPVALLAAAPVVMYGAHIGGRSIAEYSRLPAPAFRLLADMRAASETLAVRPVLAPDRRQSFDLRRPLVWLGAAGPVFDRQLAAPPQHEWMEAVKYWNGGGRAPVWFVVDPRRAAMDLIQHGEPSSYRWSVPYPALLSGTRPNDADWYRVDRPEWYVGEGWALTPEAAGVAQADGRDLAAGPIDAWIRRDAAAGGWLLVGGRNFDPAIRPRLDLNVAGLEVDTSDPIAPGAFARMVRLPGNLASGAADYLALTLKAIPPGRVAVEQFDVSAARGVMAFAGGWHERELDPSSGRQWRWMGGRAEVRYVAPPPGAVLRISGESPLKYYDRPSRVAVRLGPAVLREIAASADFTLDVKLPEAMEPSTIVVETDQTHVPAERGWRRSADRRQLGLRIFVCELRPVRQASAPGRAASSPPGR